MPERLIDVPLESLPYVDEHSTAIASSPEGVWEALVDVMVETTTGRISSRVARALGCFYTERSGSRGRIGSTIPGFVVARSVKPAVLALMGEHRFSRYALIFRITETPLEPGAGPAQRRDPRRVPRPHGAASTARAVIGPAATSWHELDPRSVRKRADTT